MSGQTLSDAGKVIQGNWTFLLDSLDVDSVLDTMFEEDYFSSSELDEITHLKIPREKSKVFLRKLILAGPKAYNAFLTALKNGKQKYVAENLEKYEPSSEVQGAEGGLPRQDSQILAPIPYADDNNDVEERTPTLGPRNSSLRTTGSIIRKETSSSGALKSKFEDRRIKLIAIGVQGSGKSTTCNRILGDEQFKTSTVGEDNTDSQKASGIKFDHHILIVDTPGLSTFVNFNNKKFIKEMKNALTLAENSPQAFVCVVAIGQSVYEISEMLHLLQKYLGDDIFKYMVFVFTNTEKLKQGEKIENIIHPSLKIYLEKCGSRFVIFTKNPSDEMNEEEVKELLDIVHTMVKKNSPSCYRVKDRACVIQ